MKVFLDTVGCRLNQSEIETMARQLIASGHEVVTNYAEADQVIINTCAVTRQATKDTRQKTRRINRENPEAEITLTGCHATIDPESVAVLPGVKNVVLNKDKTSLVQRIDPKASIDLPMFDQEPMIREFQLAGMGRTRAFLKVQDGCKNKCTFCITTVARGDGVSRHIGDVVTEVQGLLKAGYQEAVLTGVHLGSYGHDFGNRAGLRELVEMLLKHTDMPRIRLSSLEPWEIADGFFDLWQNPRLLPHLHLPLQSGSDRILRRMARRTSQESFRKLVQDAHASIPNLNITSDIIVGFPGETETDFQDTLDFVREMNFSRIHAFPYSARPNTAAAGMDGHLPNQVKKERNRHLITVAKQLGLQFNKQYEGTKTNVLWEMMAGSDENGILWSGYTDNYMRVTGYGVDLLNKITPVTLHTATEKGLSATQLVDHG